MDLADHAASRSPVSPDLSESSESILIRPNWKIVPELASSADQNYRTIAFSAGAGWGDGLHPTTQLCMQAIALFSPRDRGDSWKMLDFGSGSGLLSLAGARLGAKVLAVEIDEAGIAHAERNARLNGLQSRVQHARKLPREVSDFEENERFDLVVANILRPILLDHAHALCRCLSPRGRLVLSGLVSTDVPEVSVRYASHLNGRMPEVFQRGEWRALLW